MYSIDNRKVKTYVKYIRGCLFVLYVLYSIMYDCNNYMCVKCGNILDLYITVTQCICYVISC